VLTRRALVAGLASFFTACAGPTIVPSAGTSQPGDTSRTPGSAATPTATTPQAAATATPTVQPTSTPALTAQPPTATLPPTPPTPTATATLSPQTEIDLRLWNGSAEVQLDGRTVEPGHFVLDRGPHQAAALVDDRVVALADVPADGGSVDLIVPPPLASLAVMIENQADARPQTGLTHADVVYEALAEGGITRFIAVYLTDDAASVGPVRSLRHYFAFFAAEYGADVVHIGASPEGYAWRDALHMGHLDETFGDPGAKRVSSRPPPHNAYTDTAADRAFLQQHGWQRNHAWGPLLFSDLAPHGELSATSITLRFRPWAYHVDYAWDPGRGRYLRSMEGSPHLDADSGEQVAPATVVVQFAEVDPIPDDPKYRLDVNLSGGGGQLVVFSDGTRRDGTWSKTDPASPSLWLDAGGKPIVIPPGPVWVEVLPFESPLSAG
jgi:Protein of unknown function (DUF3048) N-terminal domain/Protein of unknown function (DUF3048) C-terminal domain